MLLLFLIAIASFFKVQSIEKSVENKNIEIINLEREAREIRELRSSWNDEEKLKSTLEGVLSSPLVSKFSPSREQVRRGVERVVIQNIDHKGAEFVTNRILNSTLKIESFEITRENEHNMSISLEVGF